MPAEHGVEAPIDHLKYTATHTFYMYTKYDRI